MKKIVVTFALTVLLVSSSTFAKNEVIPGRAQSVDLKDRVPVRGLSLDQTRNLAQACIAIIKDKMKLVNSLISIQGGERISTIQKISGRNQLLGEECPGTNLIAAYHLAAQLETESELQANPGIWELAQGCKIVHDDLLAKQIQIDALDKADLNPTDETLKTRDHLSDVTTSGACSEMDPVVANYQAEQMERAVEK